MNFSCEEEKKIFTINGIRFSGSFFQSFTCDPIGTVVQIKERKDGVVTVENNIEWDALRSENRRLRKALENIRDLDYPDSTIKHAQVIFIIDEAFLPKGESK